MTDYILYLLFLMGMGPPPSTPPEPDPQPTCTSGCVTTNGGGIPTKPPGYAE
jgi:hypothetical protein